MDIVEFISQRNSAAKLVGNAPSTEQLNKVFKAALRAPDHARLRPWRFITVQGDARQKLGELFVKAAKQENASVTDEMLDKYRMHPLRAPLLVVLVVKLQQHEKVPEIEQQLSVACAAQNILLAVEALGYAAIWRTGAHAFSPCVAQGLGLAENEQCLGFIYIGERDGKAKPLPELAVADFVSEWK